MVNSDLSKFYSYFAFAVKNYVLMMMLCVARLRAFSIEIYFMRRYVWVSASSSDPSSTKVAPFLCDINNSRVKFVRGK